MIRIILSIIFVIICIALSAIILLQEGKSQGLGAIGGMADTYWGKNKGRSMEGKLERFTKYGAILFFVLALVLNLNIL
ncbi:preprotein translocase subunit SecG [Clostridium sp. E02]|uniref:preprotein translocase subunit SecG n=1 Tax=Clostridium sp. E02 TaxID=2487134 RepID=UPI000F54417C|nr:preprotein translocase subunit SecG [Clostridium sp. E02]